MANVILVGMQWGDEGKGKVVDLYSQSADVVVRWGGGANAGHTLVVEGRKIITHLIPSGVLRGIGKQYVLADGMVIDPKILIDELKTFQDLGLLHDHHDLWVGERSHVILPYHKELDGLREAGKRSIGTTKRGIGPAYEMKMARVGVHMADLMHPKRLRERITAQLAEMRPLMLHLGGKIPKVDDILEEYLDYGKVLGPYIRDVTAPLYEEIQKGRHVLFEAAQGTLLDIDHGTYPYVTSSTTIAGGVCSSCGIGPTLIDGVIGVTKAYTTRVGSGPFPVELHGVEGDELREAGGEYGSTTGRARRCGWLDIAALRLAVRLNGLKGFALTKLDVLSGRKSVKVCVGYKLPGSNHVLDFQELPYDPEIVDQLVPVYEELPGWSQGLSDIRIFDDLPSQAKQYIRYVESQIGIPCYLVSVGASREETILLRNPFQEALVKKSSL